MKVEFMNYWIGNAMKADRAFSVNFLGVYFEWHPSGRCFEFVFLNFGISISDQKWAI